ncbi:putative nuclease HARBI1 [Merluccius polli]|uniref:Nuclease HARBI1 n=1 Tax=Merluccius polli TaxID=89951 RepID=A0AA47PCL9_MERPO|nr:putative nuclease HARBI1 [Merluccius polli]
MQVCNADDLGISQPSVSHKPNHERALVSARPCPTVYSVSFGQSTTTQEDQSQLHGSRYAGVVGAVDGTHIQIIAPSKDEDVFVNRKKVHSINTQIAFDATFNILDVAKWPAGSTHDPRILMGSGLRREAPCTSWFIRFPLDNQQLHMIKANFMACRYAGVVGAVDGTHIQIIAPSKDEDVFVNRKKVHSTNTQIAFDATFNILDVAKWPAGSTYDPRILMGSSLRREAPCTSWVSLAGAHKNTRNRFHVLHGEIRLSPERESMAGVVGAVDGTHIQIIAPSKDEDVFVNRKKVAYIPSTRRLLLMQLLTFLMLRSGLQGLPMIRVF